MRALVPVAMIMTMAPWADGESELPRPTLGPPLPTVVPVLPPPTTAENEAPPETASGPISAALGQPLTAPASPQAGPKESIGDCATEYAEPWLGKCPSFCGLPARWTVRADVGDGVGYSRGFSYLEGFVPLYQPADAEVLFGDIRVVNFDDLNRWEFNGGAGYRAHAEALDAVWGVNAFYDGRHTDTHFFHQIGVGAELIFGNWEIRSNGYIIVGDHQKLNSDSVFASVAGNQVTFDRFQTFDVAMGGFDIEAGGLLPFLPEFSPRAFIGFYHYSADGMPTANGIRGRLEAWLTPNCSLHFAIQNDAVFDTTVSGGLALHFGGSRMRHDGGPRSVEERLDQRVVRDVDIVIAQKVDVERTLVAFPVESVPPATGVSDTGAKIPVPSSNGSDGTPSPSNNPPPTNSPPNNPPPTCHPPGCCCLPFPGAPGDPSTFPGHHFPPGFHHDCFPGLGRYRHECDDDSHHGHGHDHGDHDKCDDDSHHGHGHDHGDHDKPDDHECHDHDWHTCWPLPRIRECLD